MSYSDCFERKLLRKTPIGDEEIQNQVEIAQRYIEKAERICERELFDISFLTAYISLFHSARALLYKKGYKERSHFCLFEFVKNEFADDTQLHRLAEISQQYRESRHMIQYEGALCSEDSAKEAIRDAKNFLKAAQKYV